MEIGVYPMNNTAIGDHAMYNLINNTIVNSDNTAFGYNAAKNTMANECVAFGSYALADNVSGENSAFGAQAGQKLGGTRNTALGGWAMRYCSGGDRNTVVGSRAMAMAPTDAGLVIGVNGGNDCTAVGYQAMRVNTGNRNTAIGSGCMMSILNGVIGNSGSDNTGNGFMVLSNNLTGMHNTGTGSYCMRDNLHGSQNNANGYMTLLLNTTGNMNTTNGSNSMQSNTTGSNNSANGYMGLANNSTGNHNTCSGSNALSSNTTGNHNTGLGSNTGITNLTGSNNTFVGANSNVSTNALSYSTAVGSGAIATQSNSVMLGRPTDTVVMPGGVMGSVRTITAFGPLTVDVTDYVVMTLGLITISLPSVVPNGQMFIIRNIDPTPANVLTIQVAMGQFINFSSNLTITLTPTSTGGGPSVTLIAFNNNYYVISAMGDGNTTNNIAYV
jgi:hypothetical protein